MDLRELQYTLSRAILWSEHAGELALSRFGTTLEPQRKADNSPVTEVDLLVEELITARILREFPGFGIIGEESTEPSGTPQARADRGYCWVIDPVDGTRNFIAGIPIFCVAICLLHEGLPLLSVVRDPVAFRTYSAIRGQGARMDGRRVSVLAPTPGRKVLVGIPSARQTLLPPVIVARWLRETIPRNLGVTSLHLALVAAGGLGACYAQEVKLWDVAPGALLVEEAGGVVTDPAGGNIFPIATKTYGGQDLAFLAGSPQVYGELLDSLRSG